MTTVLDHVRRTIEENHLLSPGERLVVGVSGGPDSLCLLHVLIRLQGDYQLDLHVAHLHHGLRAADADADAAFVQAVAEDWHLPYTVEQADVPALAHRHHLAVEEAARRARYAFLVRVAQTIGARTIAVAHNADDQAETVLMHWLRGSGLAGLRGMLPLTPLTDYRLLDPDSPPPQLPESPCPRVSASPGPRVSESPAPLLIRPLLEVTRADIEAYCDFYGLEPRFDRSNLDTTYFRNWLRHEVIPLLARHNPNIQEVMRRSARVIADDYALLRSLLEEAWPHLVLQESAEAVVLDLATWRVLPTSLQRSVLREAIHRLRRSLRNINFVHVENALLVARDGTTGDRATLPGGLMLTVGYDRLTIAPVAARELAMPVPGWPLLPAGGEPLPVIVPGETRLPESEWVLFVDRLDRSELPDGWEENPDPWRAFLDEEAVGDDLVLRTRLPGDRFRPLGLQGHAVKLADFLTNQKVPQPARDRLPLLAGRQGIAWVCGQRLDERARVREATARVLEARFVWGA
jgi:tRNA(Ile)-lysidine synthase